MLRTLCNQIYRDRTLVCKLPELHYNIVLILHYDIWEEHFTGTTWQQHCSSDQHGSFLYVYHEQNKSWNQNIMIHVLSKCSHTNKGAQYRPLTSPPGLKESWSKVISKGAGTVCGGTSKSGFIDTHRPLASCRLMAWESGESSRKPKRHSQTAPIQLIYEQSINNLSKRTMPQGTLICGWWHSLWCPVFTNHAWQLTGCDVTSIDISWRQTRLWCRPVLTGVLLCLLVSLQSSTLHFNHCVWIFLDTVSGFHKWTQRGIIHTMPRHPDGNSP